MSKLNSLVVGVLAIATMTTGVPVQRGLALLAPPTGCPVAAVLTVEGGAPDAEPSQKIKALATRIWAITEAVAKYHDKPCLREQLLVAGSKRSTWLPSWMCQSIWKNAVQR